MLCLFRYSILLLTLPTWLSPPPSLIHPIYHNITATSDNRIELNHILMWLFQQNRGERKNRDKHDRKRSNEQAEDEWRLQIIIMPTSTNSERQQQLALNMRTKGFGWMLKGSRNCSKDGRRIAFFSFISCRNKTAVGWLKTPAERKGRKCQIVKTERCRWLHFLLQLNF